MPMRRSIGISFACLVTSACAIAETPEENITQSTGVTPGPPETPTERYRSFACAAAQERWPADYGSEWMAQQRMSFEPVTNACSSAPDPSCGPVRVAGSSQFGKASWYDHVGNPGQGRPNLNSANSWKQRSDTRQICIVLGVT
jgi:hypothetical protein